MPFFSYFGFVEDVLTRISRSNLNQKQVIMAIRECMAWLKVWKYQFYHGDVVVHIIVIFSISFSVISKFISKFITKFSIISPWFYQIGSLVFSGKVGDITEQCFIISESDVLENLAWFNGQSLSFMETLPTQCIYNCKHHVDKETQAEKK